MIAAAAALLDSLHSFICLGSSSSILAFIFSVDNIYGTAMTHFGYAK